MTVLLWLYVGMATAVIMVQRSVAGAALPDKQILHA
jgi:hypothetical protein